MKWWREARFGLFIHWGVYSVPAGTYQGKAVESIGEWIQVTKPGRFRLTAEVAALGAGRFEVSAGSQNLIGTAPVTGDYGGFQTLELGTVELPAGKANLTVKPVADGWQPINLRAIHLSTGSL
jgi:hypothetical protein